MVEASPCPYCGKAPSKPRLDGLCPHCLVRGDGTFNSLGEPAIPPEEVLTVRGDIEPLASLEPAEVARHFSRLEVCRLLGQGGMGIVYHARQPQLHRDVALKILPPHTVHDPAFLARFTREAHALARLNHPNIVFLHDFGETRGLYYLVMEYVDGSNLRHLLASRRISPTEAVRITMQVCAGLAYAHREGLVHRDIKPENILLDKRGNVKIADFGLVKLASGPDSRHLQLTRSRQAMGTLHYVAPEQIEQPQSVDHRADIYSLGVVFYEMLTAKLPLGRFRLPSEELPLPIRFDRVVMKALDRDPDRRYESIEELRGDLEILANSDLAWGFRPAQDSDALPPGEFPTQTERDFGPSIINEAAYRQLHRPATGFLIIGALNLLVLTVLTGVVIGFAFIDFMGWRSDSLAAMWRAFGRTLLGAAIGPLLVVTSRRMDKLASLWLILTVLAGLVPISILLPFPCNWLSLPLGIWTLWILTRHEVRNSFRSGVPYDNAEQALLGLWVMLLVLLTGALCIMI